jgi:hypothetical protein
VTLDREMSISREEFMRLLPHALGPLQLSGQGPEIIATDAGRTLRIRVSELGRRRLGILELPRIRVQMEFEGFDPSGRERFLSRFDLAFLKGGG